jgi:hypothetical protein
VIELGSHDQKDNDERRYVKIIKSRGRDFVAGKHDLKISLDGFTTTPYDPP